MARTLGMCISSYKSMVEPQRNFWHKLEGGGNFGTEIPKVTKSCFSLMILVNEIQMNIIYMLSNLVGRDKNALGQNFILKTF